MKHKNIPFCLPSRPGRKTFAPHCLTCEEKPSEQGLQKSPRARELAFNSLVTVAVSTREVFVKAQEGRKVNLAVLKQKTRLDERT